MRRVEWVTQRPVAHRGLHDRAAGIIENTIAAFAAAIEAGFAMECDVQISADGEAMVFHDDTLDRLTERCGRVDRLAAVELKSIPFRAGRDRMVTLGELCEEVAGRLPLFVEVKASWSSDRRLEERVSALLSTYPGPVAVMSFDPGSTAWFRRHAPNLPRGVVQESRYADPEWRTLSPMRRFALGHLMHLPQSRPDFLAWFVGDLAYRTPQLARSLLGLPLLTWTVRSPEDQARAGVCADQMIFEGFRP
jgi:glycerophosphoryl diester phosphodiesterase